MGDRWCHLAFARHRLGGRPSPVYESATVGGPPQRAYLNGVLEVESAEDGVVGLEGDGPVRGTPIDVGVLVMGDNAAAVDATATRIMGLAPERIQYMRLTAG